MAIYRNVHLSFWSDSKVTDDFSPEDRLVFLYALTNPHTNLCGCYEISMKQIALETGYSTDVAKTIIDRLSSKHNVIRYDPNTKELLVINWSRYNWTTSEKFLIPLKKEIENVKNPEFKAFLTDRVYGIDTVSIPYGYPMDTTVTVTDTDTVTDTVNTLEDDFDELWKMYPASRRGTRKKTLEYYKRDLKHGATHEQIRRGLENYLEYVKAEGTAEKYIKQFQTFMSQSAWQDEWIPSKKPVEVKPKRDPITDGKGATGFSNFENRQYDEDFFKKLRSL